MCSYFFMRDLIQQTSVRFLAGYLRKNFENVPITLNKAKNSQSHGMRRDAALSRTAPCRDRLRRDAKEARKLAHRNGDGLHSRLEPSAVIAAEAEVNEVSYLRGIDVSGDYNGAHLNMFPRVFS